MGWPGWIPLMLAALIGAGSPWPAAADAADLATARSATIEIDESYRTLRSLDDRRRPVDVPTALPTVTLPFRSVIETLLGHAGIAVARDAGAAADLRIVIFCRGTTRGQLYDAAIQGRRIRELRYTDAAIAGSLRLARDDALVERAFTGEIAPAVTIIGIVDGGDVRRDPNYAPFREAFEAPGGFLDALGRALCDIWGEAPLRRALGDRDPLVRAAAGRALE